MNNHRKKVPNGSAIFPLSAISRFCGLPIGLTTLPIVTENASANSISFGDISCFLAIRSTIGVTMMAIVSFISTAEAPPKPNMINSIRESTEFACLKYLYAACARYPLSSSACPMINIPNRKNITSKLIARKASSGIICPVTSTVPAPNAITCHI